MNRVVDVSGELETRDFTGSLGNPRAVSATDVCRSLRRGRRMPLVLRRFAGGRTTGYAFPDEAGAAAGVGLRFLALSDMLGQLLMRWLPCPQ